MIMVTIFASANYNEIENVSSWEKPTVHKNKRDTTPVNAGDAGEEDNAALLSEIEALVINADMDQVQLQKHLDDRRVKMMNRTRQRNATRKAKRLAAKKKEIQVK